MAPEEVDRFTPGGIGATLSPTSAILRRTTPVKGARMRVLQNCASATDRLAFDCATAASAMRTRLSAASRRSRDTTFSRSSSTDWRSCRFCSARSASLRCTAARALATWAA